MPTAILYVGSSWQVGRWGDGSPASLGLIDRLDMATHPTGVAGRRSRGRGAQLRHRRLQASRGDVRARLDTVTNGSASMTTILDPGSHSLTAVFTPNDSTAYNGSASDGVTYVVSPPTQTPPSGIIPTTAALQVAPIPGYVFFPEILIARVSPVRASGTMQFMDGSAPLGVQVPVTAGFAFLVAPLPKGAHSLTAVFIPTDTAAYAPSTSPSVPLTVNPLFRLR